MTVKQVDRALKGLSVSDRVGSLIMSLSAEGKDSIGAIKNLIAVAALLGQNLLDPIDRLQCSKVFRECATEIEAEHQPLVKE